VRRISYFESPQRVNWGRHAFLQMGRKAQDTVGQQ
jgi:hypothetical protein